MRIVRLSLVGTVILVVLGGLGGAAQAQETEVASAEPSQGTDAQLSLPAAVTGIEYCSIERQGETLYMEGGVELAAGSSASATTS